MRNVVGGKLNSIGLLHEEFLRSTFLRIAIEIKDSVVNQTLHRWMEILHVALVEIETLELTID